MAYKLGSNSNSGAYGSMQKTGLIAGDQNIFSDGEPKEKVKVKVNKKGETKTKKTTILADGTKIKSKHIQGPTTYKVNEAAEISANVGAEVKPTVGYFGPKVDFKPPSVEKPSSEEGSDKPFVKPLRSRKEAFENRGEQFKDMDFPEYNEYINKWNKENPPKNNPGKKDDGDIGTMPGRRAVRLEYNTGGNLKIKGVKTITPSTYSSYEEKIKKPKDDNPPPSNPPGGGNPPGDGLCTKDNPDACTAAFEEDGAPGSMVNKMMAAGDNEKLASKNADKDAKSRKSAADKIVKSSTKNYRKEQLAKVKQGNKDFAKEMGAETKAERKQVKSYQKDKKTQAKIDSSDRFKAAESRKNKNARERFRQANRTLSSRATVGDKIGKVGAKITTSLLGKRKQQQRATAGKSTAAKNIKTRILKNEELAATMTNKNKKNKEIKARF